MAVTHDVRVQVKIFGSVPPELPGMAEAKVGALLRHVGEPVLAARVMLATAPDQAVERRCVAAAMVSINGRIVRAEAAAATMRDALDEMVSRLRVRLQRAWPSRHRSDSGVPLRSSWGKGRKSSPARRKYRTSGQMT